MAANLNNKICPVCEAEAVHRNGVALGVREPPFLCENCGAELTSAPTAKMLMVLPLLALVCAAIYFFKVLMGIAGVGGNAQLALGLFVAILGANLVGRVAKKSFEYRSWKARGSA